MLLESYFTLNKEQRQKFLTKEERKELRIAKRERKMKENPEEEQEEIEEVVEEVKKSKKNKKEKKSKKEKKEIVEEEVVEEEEEQEEIVVKEKKSKKDKKAKKAKKVEVEQESESDQEQKISKKKVKTVQNDDSSSEEQKVGDDIDAEKWRKENELVISGVDSENKKFYPFSTFKNTGMPYNVMQATKGFVKPSIIQSASWPILLQGRDCIAIAETGSGKTLGFLLPAYTHILKTTNDISNAKLPRVIIVSPTRELASQIHEVCQSNEKILGIKSVCLYGGISKSEQKQMLRSGVQIIIATPGRLKDLMQEGCVKTEEVTMIVLDEADRMLDMGFKPDITYIYSKVRPNRQSVMFSATWPKEVKEIAATFLKDPIMIKIGDDEGSANKRVKQTVEVIKGYQRNNRLTQLLKEYNVNNEKIIVFVLYKQEASRMEEFIKRLGCKVVALHGDMSQKARNQAFLEFKEGTANILVATDVAARGLDIPNVEHVINYSFPLTCSDYVHRIGRTGRAGKYGNSYTFFQEDQDKKLAGDLVQIMKEAGQEPNPELIKFGPSIHKQAQHSMYGAHFKEVDMTKKATKTLL